MGVTEEIPEAQPELVDIARREIAAAGKIDFARYMQLALYHNDFGYYRSEARRPGRGGDFLTAPEMHPLFGLALSRQVLECWQRLGEPSSFTVREYGAGIGGLAYDVMAGLLDAEPRLETSLRYEMIEVNDFRRNEAMQAMTEVGLAGMVMARAEANRPLGNGVILANEVADALPVHRLVVRGASLKERWVVHGDDGEFAWQEGELSPEITNADVPGYLRRAGVDLGALPDGSIIDFSVAAGTWMAEIGRTLQRGYVLIIDYGYPVQELLRDHRLDGTVRGYTQHTVNDNPLQAMGMQDLTAHVDFTCLMQAAEAAGMKTEGLTTQGDFLARIGLGQLLVDMQQQEGMTLDVYYRAQAAVYRLIDPGGMGRFRVLGVSRDVDAAPLTGFVDTGLTM